MSMTPLPAQLPPWGAGVGVVAESCTMAMYSSIVRSGLRAITRANSPVTTGVAKLVAG